MQCASQPIEGFSGVSESQKVPHLSRLTVFLFQKIDICSPFFFPSSRPTPTFLKFLQYSSMNAIWKPYASCTPNTSGFCASSIAIVAGALYCHEFVPSLPTPSLMLYDITLSSFGPFSAAKASEKGAINARMMIKSFFMMNQFYV